MSSEAMLVGNINEMCIGLWVYVMIDCYWIILFVLFRSCKRHKSHPDFSTER